MNLFESDFYANEKVIDDPPVYFHIPDVEGGLLLHIPEGGVTVGDTHYEDVLRFLHNEDDETLEKVIQELYGISFFEDCWGDVRALGSFLNGSRLAKGIRNFRDAEYELAEIKKENYLKQ